MASRSGRLLIACTIEGGDGVYRFDKRMLERMLGWIAAGKMETPGLPVERFMEVGSLPKRGVKP